MVLRFFLVAVAFLFMTCAEGERDNPDDRESKYYIPSSSSSVVVPPSTYTLACAAVPSTGIVSTTIIPPVVTCNGIVVGYGLDWTGAPNWNNPAIGTYSDISIMASYGECNGKTASCSGTLTVIAAPSADELTCTGMPAAGVTGTAITQPTVRCGINAVTSDITWANTPAWDNPTASTYNVSATASCGGSSKTASCGKLTIASVLACGFVPPSGTAGTAITAPAVTCNGTTIDSDDLNWAGAPNWNNPEAGTYNNISVSASYGECYGITATCGGTLTVGSVLACSAVPSTGIAGETIIPPTVTCNGTDVPSSILNWTGAPDWNNPEVGTHNNISVSASYGECNGKTTACDGTLTVGEVPSVDELTCTGMPVTVVTGTAKKPPAVRCGINIITSGITWENAPTWTNPTAATYNVSATASCGGKQQTASCGTLVVASTYTVTYNAGTGVTGVTVPENQTKIQDVALTLSVAVPTRTGYTFAGWNTLSNGSGTSYASGASYTANADVTLYAKWTANTYTVTYNANGGTGGPASQTKTHDVALTLSGSVPTRTGYVFAGWNTSSNGNGTNYVGGSYYTANADVTLYAQWTVTYTLACANVPTTGTAGKAMTAPTVTCNGSNGTSITVSSGLGWTSAPNWSSPMAGTYSGISVEAIYGECSGKTATCSGTLTVATPVTYTLTCASVPSSGTAGTAITAPTVTCNGSNSTSTTVSSGLSWTGAPAWSNPVAGTYSSVSVSTSSGNCSGKTATCSGTLTIISSLVVYGTPITYESETYQTVIIGTQTWMARNLNYDVSGSKCLDCATYGRLYDWSTAMALPSTCNSSNCASQVSAKHRGICPSGWHIPSDAEWITLIDFVGGSSTAGTKLRATSGWDEYRGTLSGTDDYGFSALPGGYIDSVGSGSLWLSGLWWSSSECGGNNIDCAYNRHIYYDRESFNNGLSFRFKSFLLSVRCLKD